MIESSVIKLILIVTLNVCCVWVWVKKENLRSFMPFEFIRKLEGKEVLKNSKKTITYIGNISINIFWVFNFLYVIITAKAFEKVLDITLGFSYGFKYIEKSIETLFFKVDYFNIKSLDEATAFLLDTSNVIALFIGITALMIPIYLYIISFKSKSKRQLLLMLTKKGDMFYISFFIYVMLFFRVEKIFLVGVIGYLIYLLMEAVKWIMGVENLLYSFKGLDKAFKTQKEKEILQLYNAILNELYQGVKDKNISLTDENKELLVKMLKSKKLEVKVNSRELLRTLHEVYSIAIQNQDNDVFEKISYLHIDIAQYYLKNNDQDRFYTALVAMTKVYDYYSKDGTDEFALNVVSGFRFDTFGIYEKYKKNFKECIEWYCQKFRVIVEGIKRTVKNDDLYFFKQFIYLIEQEFEYKENLKRDYKLLEKSVYFGILLYLKEEKRKSKGDKNLVEKIDRFIEFLEKRFLSDTGLIYLIELYKFIEEEIYGYNEDSMKDRLNWDEYFRPKIELVKTRAYSVRTNEEKKKLFFELLGKRNFEEWKKNKLLDEKELQEYIKGKLDMEKSFNPYNKKKEDSEVEEEIKTLIKRVNKFKKKANWLLNDLKDYQKELKLTDKEYQKIKKLLEEISLETKNEEDKTVMESEISDNKINIFKEELEKILSKSRIIKWLNNSGKYKEDIKEKQGETRYIGQYMQKEYFVELGDEGGTKAIAESYGKGQNKAIEQIMIDNIEAKQDEINSIEEALEKIKGEPWIVLTGIGIHNFFYEESGKKIGNIVLKTDLGEEYFERYGDVLKGIYKYKGTKIPIYNFSSDKKGIYILDSNDIEGFVHYDPKEEDENSENIEKRFDKKVGYSHLTIIETEKIIESGKREEILKSGVLKNYETDEEKLNQFKQLIWITSIQKGELKLKDDAVVYKVEFNG